MGARTLFLVLILGALSILLRVLLPKEIGTAAVTVLGLTFAAYLVAIICTAGNQLLRKISGCKEKLD